MVTKLVGDYIITPEVLGRGASGEVKKAKLIKDDTKLFAVKIYPLMDFNEDKKKYFLKELEIMKTLKNKNIVQLKDHISTTNNNYIFMDYCEGGTLKKYLANTLDYKQKKQLIKGIFDGLLYMNSKKFSHRDIKLDNILIHKGRPKIADFGFSKELDEMKTRLGTPDYVPYEILANKPYNEKCDIWSLGITIYQIMFGVNTHPVYFKSGQNYQQRAETLKKFSLTLTTEQQSDKTLGVLLQGMLKTKQEDRFNWTDAKSVVDVWLKEDAIEPVVGLKNPPLIIKSQEKDKKVEYSMIVNGNEFNPDKFAEETLTVLQKSFLSFLERKNKFAFFLSRTVKLISNEYKDQKLKNLTAKRYMSFLAYTVLLMNREFVDIKDSLENGGKYGTKNDEINIKNLRKIKKFQEEIENAKKFERKSSRLLDYLIDEMEENLKNKKFDVFTEFKKKIKTPMTSPTVDSELWKEYKEICAPIFYSYNTSLKNISDNELDLLYSIHLILMEMENLRIFDSKERIKDLELNRVTEKVRGSRAECIEEISKNHLSKKV